MAIENGRFREDLYYRLKVVTIWLPLLKERVGDIPLLSEYFLSRFFRELGLDCPGITPEAELLLASYPWPGNVRELANIIQKTVIFNRGAPLSADDISHAIREKSQAAEDNEEKRDQLLRRVLHDALMTHTGENLFDTIMDQVASVFISEALNMSAGNRSRAAKLLGLSRPTLHSKIEKYGLKFETSVKDGNKDA
jgi:DNA-binding NtrC family response regulator